MADPSGCSSFEPCDPTRNGWGEFNSQRRSASDPHRRCAAPLQADELPQLWNVLCGEMSLVGPRPEVQRFVDLYTEEEKAILTVRPGLTDWASLWNIDEGAILEGSADPDRAYCELIRPKKLLLQLAYVRQAGFWTDLGILFQTIGAVLFRLKFREARALELGA